MAALPFCHTELRASKPKPSHYPKQLNTLGDHIRTRRLDLRLRKNGRHLLRSATDVEDSPVMAQHSSCRLL
jgi:hypothetical protein